MHQEQDVTFWYTDEVSRKFSMTNSDLRKWGPGGEVGGGGAAGVELRKPKQKSTQNT